MPEVQGQADFKQEYEAGHTFIPGKIKKSASTSRQAFVKIWLSSILKCDVSACTTQPAHTHERR